MSGMTKKKSFAPCGPTVFCSAVSLCWERRHPYLCQIYRTGEVPRRDVGSLAVRETITIPDDVLAELLAMPSPSIKQSLTIPDDVLFPKPKRGRPRNDALRRQANDLQCSARHARRLLATSKPRQRDRERQPDVIEALQACQKRAALVREMEEETEEETVVSYLSFAISYLRNKTVTSYSEEDCRLARRWVEYQGLVAPVLIVSAAMGSKSFHIDRIDAKILRISRATIYRHYGSRLDEFRRRAQDLLGLPVVDWKKMANMELPKRKRGVLSRPDTAWEEQTTFRQRYEHHDW
jgi:hypothetical protein